MKGIERRTQAAVFCCITDVMTCKFPVNTRQQEEHETEGKIVNTRWRVNQPERESEGRAEGESSRKREKGCEREEEREKVCIYFWRFPSGRQAANRSTFYLCVLTILFSQKQNRYLMLVC